MFNERDVIEVKEGAQREIRTVEAHFLGEVLSPIEQWIIKEIVKQDDDETIIKNMGTSRNSKWIKNCLVNIRKKLKRAGWKYGLDLQPVTRIGTISYLLVLGEMELKIEPPNELVPLASEILRGRIVQNRTTEDGEKEIKMERRDYPKFLSVRYDRMDVYIPGIDVVFHEAFFSRRREDFIRAVVQGDSLTWVGDRFNQPKPYSWGKSQMSRIREEIEEIGDQYGIGRPMGQVDVIMSLIRLGIMDLLVAPVTESCFERIEVVKRNGERLVITPNEIL